MAKAKTKSTPKKKHASSKKKRKKTTSKRNQKKSLIMRLIRWVFILAIWGTLFLGGVILWYAKDLPDITKAATFEHRNSIIVKSVDGQILARYGETKGQNLNVKDLPDNLIHAVLATEDRRFYSHFGVDPIGLTRAMATNVIKGRFVQGGSTITQQLAKNLFLTHDRKITRKIKEAILAVWLERELTKDEILSAYMNRVYLGSGTYGFDAAARLYFDKSAKDVNLHEAAILAGLLKAPSKYSPHNNLDLAKERAQVVLGAMIDARYIKKSDMTETAMALALPHKKSANGKNTRYFTDWVIEGVDDLIGHPDMDLIIETTLNANLQDSAQSILTGAIDTAPEDYFVSQGAILSMRPDGAVITMVGGYDYGQSQFNRTTLALRPPGSSFKPFVFLAALREGWHYDDTILDAPITEGKYRPKNYAGKYYGEVTLEQALAKSMNTATLRIAQDIGVSNIKKTARDLGILENLNNDMSITLGSSGIPMLQIATAYSTIANGGHRVYPYAINRITNGDNGRVLYERKTQKSYQSIINGKNIAELSHMMASVINDGTGRAAKLPYPAYGKTGTSQDNRDAWFAGFTDKVVTIVWLGNDDNSPMRKITGGGAPAQIWRNVMLKAHPSQPNLNFPKNNINENGFSNLLGRLISGNQSSPRPDNSRSPYGNLND
ncbi:MAG: transglycosylase domain-containing protein [Alphaproteobacteria bacterium]